MKFITYVTDLFFPPQCIFCDSSLKPAARPLLCSACAEKYIEDKNICPKCKTPLTANDALMPVCRVCKIAGRHYDGGVYVADYAAGVRDAIRKYKFSKQIYIAPQLSELLAAKIKSTGINKYNTDFIMSVPSDKKRNAERGFDAAGNIAGKTAKLLRMKYAENGILRVKDIALQSSLSLSQRQSNVRGAFKVENPDFVRGKKILLIDDIITTGATVTEISRILRRAGAEYIFVASVARTVIKV